MSTALFCTSRSGSCSSFATAAILTLLPREARALSAALRTILFGSLSWTSSAALISALSNRLSRLMRWILMTGSLPAHPGDEVGNHFGPDRVLDDLEDGGLLLDVEVVGALQQFVHAEVVLVDLEDFDQGRFRDFVVVEQVEQLVGVVVGGAGQRPGGAGHHPLVAVGEPVAVVVEGLVVDERGEDVDKHHRVRLVGHGERVDDLRDDFRADLLELADEPLRAPALVGLLFGDQLLDQLVRSKRSEQAHFGAPWQARMPVRGRAVSGSPCIRHSQILSVTNRQSTCSSPRVAGRLRPVRPTDAPLSNPMRRIMPHRPGAQSTRRPGEFRPGAHVLPAKRYLAACRPRLQCAPHCPLAERQL